MIRNVQFIIRRDICDKKCKTYERSFICHEKVQNQMKCSTTCFLNNMLDLPILNFPTLLQNRYQYLHLSYVNTAAVAPYSIPHCTLTAFLLTAGSVAIPAIPGCFESSLACLQLILYSGHGTNAAHCPQTVWRLSVCPFNL